MRSTPSRRARRALVRTAPRPRRSRSTAGSPRGAESAASTRTRRSLPRVRAAQQRSRHRATARFRRSVLRPPRRQRARPLLEQVRRALVDIHHQVGPGRLASIRHRKLDHVHEHQLAAGTSSDLRRKLGRMARATGEVDRDGKLVGVLTDRDICMSSWSRGQLLGSIRTDVQAGVLGEGGIKRSPSPSC